LKYKFINLDKQRKKRLLNKDVIETIKDQELSFRSNSARSRSSSRSPSRIVKANSTTNKNIKKARPLSASSSISSFSTATLNSNQNEELKKPKQEKKKNDSFKQVLHNKSVPSKKSSSDTDSSSESNSHNSSEKLLEFIKEKKGENYWQFFFKK
jgi:hypothetical protein